MAFSGACRSSVTWRGKHFVIEYRSADGLDERFPELAADLVRLKVDLIVTRGTQAILATKNATDTIPIVITGAGDPPSSEASRCGSAMYSMTPSYSTTPRRAMKPASAPRSPPPTTVCAAARSA